jgi:RNA polymerase sigma factor (sigma-70 family)
MATTPMSEVLQRLRRAALRQPGAELSDGQLLECFLSRREGAALEALVRRHAAMVWGVCRRVLTHYHDAEDAFQATFLVLVRRAASIVPRELLANWLYGVAYQTARKVRATAVRRKGRERQVTNMPDPAAAEQALWSDLQPLLDAALSRLPEKYRSVIVLCDLEGLSRKDVARQVGLPEGTVGSRLARARALLARRLARRGVAVSGGVLAAVLLPKAAFASAPAAVVASTVKAVRLLAAGRAVAPGVISLRAAALAEGGLKTMLLTRLNSAAVALLLGGMIALAYGVCAAQHQAAEAGDGKATAKGQARPEGQAAQGPRGQRGHPGILLLARLEALVALTPEGKDNQGITLPKDSKLHIFSGRFSPDGSRVAYVVTAKGPPRPPARVGEAVEAWPYKVVVCKLGAAKPAAVIDLPAQQVHVIWAPDGKRLLVTKEMGLPEAITLETIRLDPQTGRVEPFELPAGARLLDCSRDGKTLLVVQKHNKKHRLGLVAATGGKEVRELLVLNRWIDRRAGRFSPDGTKVLYTDADPEDKAAMKKGMSSKPYLLDLATRKSQALADFPTNGQALGVAWSPDGRRVAYTWRQVHRDLLKKESWSINDVTVPTEAFLIVADADGRNARTIASGRSDYAINPILGVVDWR